VSAITFTVSGRPQQRGSKTPWVPRRKDGSIVTRADGRPVIATMDSNKKSKAWLQAVRDSAAEACGEGFELFRGPVRVMVTFYFARPKNHFRTGKHSSELRGDAKRWHTSTPDVCKLIRTIHDGLTGTVIADDKQICSQSSDKFYTTQAERAVVTVAPIADVLAIEFGQEEGVA